MTSVVLDASAVIALLRDEPGAAEVAKIIDRAVISAVNLQEVAKELLVSDVPADIAREMVDELRLTVRPHDDAAAWASAGLVHATQAFGRGLGDRSCIALAIAEGAPAMTADKAWAR